MAVRDILLDTNAYVAFKRGMPDAVEVITHAPRIGINSIVLGELLSGFVVGTREAENRQELEQFLASERVHQLVIDAATAAQYAGVYRELRRRGRPIPTNDMWIAASALQHGFAVFSDDGHFHEVCGLHVGMRLDDFLFCEERPVRAAKRVRLHFLTKRDRVRWFWCGQRLFDDPGQGKSLGGPVVTASAMSALEPTLAAAA